MARTPTDPTKAQVWITKGLDDLDFEFYFPQGPKGDPGGITLGTALGTDDLNTITNPGLYRQLNGSNATTGANYPNGQGQGFDIEVHQIGTGGSLSVLQKATPIFGPNNPDGRGFYVRRLNAAVWQPWRFFSAQRVDQTAGRAIYTYDDVNNREQLIWGDTGWRDISSLVTGSAGTLFIRRIGQIVTLQANSIQEASTVTGVRIAVAGNQLPGFLPSGAGVPRTAAITFSNTVYVMEMLTSGELRRYTAETSPPAVSFTFSYPTNSAWPTSLPGTANGSVPNT